MTEQNATGDLFSTVESLGGRMCNCYTPTVLGPAGQCPDCLAEGPQYRETIARHRQQQANGTAISAADNDLLDRLTETLRRYVILPDDAHYDAVVLWIAASHAPDVWPHAPRLVIVSPEKRCGKSRLLDIIEATCHNPLMTVNISSAALVRSITPEMPPTILLDEADTIFGSKRSAEANEDLRGILNAGFDRGRPYRRWNVNTNSVEDCPSFAFAALAGIGNLPDTIMDRAVIIPMRRRASGEKVSPFRTKHAVPLRALGNEIHGWLTAYSDDLADNDEPLMPVEDREFDVWQPLVAVADLARGDWPARARRACVALTSVEDAVISAGVRLLTDIRTVFGDADNASTAALIAGLCQLDESPWPDFHGRNITPRDIAELLKPYGVAAESVKIAGKTLRGYKRTVLNDAWDRYLGCATSATCATSQVNEGGPVARLHIEVQPATEHPPLTSTVAQVAQVAHTGKGTCEDCGAPTPRKDMPRCAKCVIKSLP